MSHYTCMIIGEDPEKQLTPYDESIEVPRYKREDVSEKDLESFKETYTIYKKDRTYGAKSQAEAEKNAKLNIIELYESFGDDWNGKEWTYEDGKFVRYSTYNPKSKWDWYQLGGRWKGFLKLKKGAKGVMGESGAFGNEAPKGNYADQAKLKDIDIEGMINDAKEEAKAQYEKVEKAIGGTIPKIAITWGEICDDEGKYKDMAWDKRRELYNSQPEVELFANKCKEVVGFFGSIDEYQISKEEYIENAGNSAISTFAVLKNGEWFEKGKMGWWGISTDKMTQSEWDKKVAEMLKELDGETLISIYDCHI